MKKRIINALSAICIISVLAINCSAFASDNGSGGVTGIEPQNASVGADTSAALADFRYELIGDEISLKEVKGYPEVVYVDNYYTVDGIQHHTNLDDFQIRNSQIKAVVFSVGIANVQEAVFNGSTDIRKVYFPITMEKVTDNCLAYLTPDEGEKIQIYYEGSQEQWQNIFKVFERTPVGEAESAGEAGAALADWLNEKVGHKYDSEKFEYFFNAIPEDLVASLN